MRRIVFILIACVTMFSFAESAVAQVKNGVHTKLAKYFVNEQWEDLAFKCDKMIVLEKNKNDAELYLYTAYAYAKIFTMCLENPEMLNKTPEYLNSYNLALKYSVYAKKKDKKAKVFFPDNNDLLKEIAVIGMYYVDHYVGIGKYSKANSRLRKMLKTYSDENFVALNGVLSAIGGDTATANPIFRNIELMAEKGNNKSLDTDFAMIDAFDVYASWLVKNERTEEAKSFLTLGLKIFPDEPMLIYDLSVINDPEYSTENAKPSNSKKDKFLEKASAISDEDEDDEDEDYE